MLNLSSGHIFLSLQNPMRASVSTEETNGMEGIVFRDVSNDYEGVCGFIHSCDGAK